MKRDFNVVVKNYDGRPYLRNVFKFDEKGLPVITNKEHEFSHHEPMTLRLVALDALAGRWRGEEGMSLEQSHKRMKLHDRLCFSDGVVELTGEEGAMILEAMKAQGRDHVLIGRMKDLLDTDPPGAQ